MLIKKVIIIFMIITLGGCFHDNNSNYFEVKLVTKDQFGQVSTSFVQGEDIQIVLSIKNISSQIRSLKFSSGKQYDFIIKNIDGEPVWRWSSGMSFTEAESSYNLAPDEVRIITHSWNQILSDTEMVIPVGNYTIESDDIGINVVSKQELTIM